MNEEKLIIAFDAKQKEVLNSLDKVGARLAGLEKKAETVGKKTSGLGKMMAKGLGSAIKMATKLTAALGVGGVVGALYKAVRVTEDFEKKLFEVGTLLGNAADKKIPKFEKAIRSLALRSNASVTELTEGLYQVISAGTKGTESVAGAMKLLETSQKAAVAGVADTFSTVDVLTTALNAYGASAADATRFSDMLFTTVKMGKVNLSELSHSLGMVVSNAAGAGVSFEEVNAAMAATTKAGVPVQRAVTSINAAIRVLSKGTKELDKALGESASDLLRREGFVGAMERLREVTNGDTIAMQQLGIEQEAIAGLSVLAGTGIDNFREALDAMRDSTGATDEAFQRMSKTFAFQKRQFWNKLNDMLLDIGSEIMPMVVGAMDDFSYWVKNNKDEIIGFIKDLIGFLGTVLKTLKGILQFIFKVTNAISKMGGVASQMTEQLARQGLIGTFRTGEKGREAIGRAWEEATAAANVPVTVPMIGSDIPLPPRRTGKPGGRGKPTGKAGSYRESLGLIGTGEGGLLGLGTMMGEAAAYAAAAAQTAAARRESAVGRVTAGAREGYLDMRAAWSEKMAQKFGKKVGEEAGKSWLDEVVTGFLERAGEALWNIGLKTGEIMAAPFNQVYQLLVAAFGGDIDQVKGLVDQFVGMWENLAENLDEILEYIVSEGVPRIMDAFISSLPVIVDAVAEWLPVLIEQLIGYLPAVITAVINGIPEIIGAIIAHLPQIVGAFISAVPQIALAFIKLIPKIALEFAKAIAKALIGMVTGKGKKGKGKGGGKSKMPTLMGRDIQGFHAGGFVDAAGRFSRGAVDFSNAVRAHGGMYVGGLGTGEVPAVLQAGEGVLNRAVTSAIGGREGIDRVNRGEGLGGNHYHVHADHVFADDIASVLDSIMAGNLRRGSGVVYRSLRAGVPGFSSMRGRGR